MWACLTENKLLQSSCNHLQIDQKMIMKIDGFFSFVLLWILRHSRILTSAVIFMCMHWINIVFYLFLDLFEYRILLDGSNVDSRSKVFKVAFRTNVNNWWFKNAPKVIYPLSKSIYKSIFCWFDEYFIILNTFRIKDKRCLLDSMDLLAVNLFCREFSLFFNIFRNSNRFKDSK